MWFAIVPAGVYVLAAVLMLISALEIGIAKRQAVIGAIFWPITGAILVCEVLKEMR